MAVDKLRETLSRIAKIGESIKPIDLGNILSSERNHLLPSATSIPDLSGLEIDYENGVSKKMDGYIRLLEEQNVQLSGHNKQLRKLYRFMQEERIKSQKQARSSRRFAWLSLIIGTIIGLLGVFIPLLS